MGIGRFYPSAISAPAASTIFHPTRNTNPEISLDYAVGMILHGGAEETEEMGSVHVRSGGCYMDMEQCSEINGYPCGQAERGIQSRSERATTARHKRAWTRVLRGEGPAARAPVAPAVAPILTLKIRQSPSPTRRVRWALLSGWSVHPTYAPHGNPRRRHRSALRMAGASPGHASGLPPVQVEEVGPQAVLSAPSLPPVRHALRPAREALQLSESVSA